MQAIIIFLGAFVEQEKPINMGFVFVSVAYVLYVVSCPHIPRTTHYFNKERTITMEIHFTYYNQYKNGIDTVFADNTLMYATLALDCELQAWADAMDEDWRLY